MFCQFWHEWFVKSLDAISFVMGATILFSLRTISRDPFRWLYSCDKSSYIRSVYCQSQVVLLKCTEQNVNNQTLTQVLQLYVHVFFCFKVIRSWINMPTGGHGHVICMCVYAALFTYRCILFSNLGQCIFLLFYQPPFREV